MDQLLWAGAELLVWMESNLAVSAGAIVLLLVPGAICCWAARRGAAANSDALAHIDRRLTHICSALELLTDTSESSLRSAFAEIERLSAEQGIGGAHHAAMQQRLRTAVRSGQSAHEIARSEGVSEGEVRLRLRLQGDLENDTPVHPVVQ